MVVVVRNLFEKLALRGFRQANCSCSSRGHQRVAGGGRGVVLYNGAVWRAGLSEEGTVVASNPKHMV